MAQDAIDRNQLVIIAEPKWKGRRKVKHVVRLLAAGSLLVTLHRTITPVYDASGVKHGWSIAQQLVQRDSDTRDVTVLSTVVFVTSGVAWIVPADCNLVDQVDCIGGGGSGSRQTNSGGNVTGGAGAAWARATGIAVTPNASITIQVGAGGASVTGTTAGPVNGNIGTDTWWNGATLALSKCGAKAGLAGKSAAAGGAVTGPLGGAEASCIGGVGGGTLNPGTSFARSGGAGGSIGSGHTTICTGGGGAGGSTGNGTSAPTNSTATSASDGGSGDAGVGGAAGAAALNTSLPGGDGTEYQVSPARGSGGGAGASVSSANATAGAGGNFGAGGAGAGTTGAGATTTSGAGAPGLIVIVYTPTVPKFVDNAGALFPRRLNFARRGATMLGDGGIAAPKTFVATAAWHIQPPQPPSPLRSSKKYGAIVSDDDGTADALRQFKDMGFEIAPPPLLRLPTLYRNAAAVMEGDDGTYQAYALWLNAGYEVQPPQPPHPRPEKFGAMVPDEDGTESPTIFYPAGWEIQSHQPRHPRPEKAGAIAAGDDGDEYPFIFITATPAWQFSAQEFQPPGACIRQRGAVFPDDPSGFNDQPPLINFYPAGWEIQAVQPPHRRPERFGAIAPREDGIERPLVNLYPMGWEVQPPQPLQPPVGKARIRAAIMRGDDGTIRPFVVQLATGWEIQSVQPPRFLPWYRRAAALMIGDDGTYRQYASWRNFEWGVQNFQPPHPHPEQRFAAIAPKDDGITATYFTWQNAGWEIQPPQPPTQPSVRKRAPGAAGRSLFAAPGLFVPMGWEIAAPNPQHLRRFNSLPIQDIDAAFVGPVVVYPSGWENQPPPPPRFPSANRRAGAIASRDDGIQYPLLRLLGFGFENQPWQPKHPRPERGAAVLLGDDGIEGTFTGRPLTAWGYEQPFLFPRYPVPRRAAALAGAENIPAVLRRLAPMGWEPTPPFFRHPRPERAGAIMAGDSGAEAPFVARVATGWGFEPPVLALRRAISRGAGLAGRAEGTDAAFQFFRPMGWEPSEPIRRPRRGWRGPQIFEPPRDGLLPFPTPRWIDARTDQLRPWARARGGALAGPWLADHVEARVFTLDGLDWWPPETFYRRRYVGGALPYEGGWMLPRFVSVFYASTILTRASGLVTATQGRGESVLSRAGASPEVSQASGQTVTTAAAGQTVVKGEQRGQ